LATGASGHSTPCQIEVRAIDFPAVQIDGNAILQPKKETILKVAGTPNGKHAVELEIELRLQEATFAGNETQPAKARIAIAAFTKQPDLGLRDAGLADLPEKRIELRRMDLEGPARKLDTRLNVLEKAVREARATVETLKRKELILTNPMRPQNPRELNAFLADARYAQELLEQAEENHTRAVNARRWIEDMLTLIRDLENKARLEFRVFRPLGNEVIEVHRASATP
jgi:hypothetical protein